MGLRTALHDLSWPTILSFLFHLISTPTLTILNKTILQNLLFHYPTTLSLIQTLSLTLCLWFWSIFGLFKVRLLPFLKTLHLALPASINLVLTLLSLRHNSLLVHQAFRLLPPPLLALHNLLRPVHPHPSTPLILLSTVCIALGAAILAHTEPAPSPYGPPLALLSALFATASHIATAPTLRHTRANELQLQLCVKTATAFLLAIFAPLLDDYSPSSSQSIFSFVFDEGATILIFATGLLAFFSFVSSRAAVHRLHHAAYDNLVYLVAIVVFASHFIVFEHPVTPVVICAIFFVMLGTIVLTTINGAATQKARRRRRQMMVTDGVFDQEEDTASDLEMAAEEDGPDWGETPLQNNFEPPRLRQGTVARQVGTPRALAQGVSPG